MKFKVFWFSTTIDAWVRDAGELQVFLVQGHIAYTVHTTPGGRTPQQITLMHRVAPAEYLRYESVRCSVLEFWRLRALTAVVP